MANEPRLTVTLTASAAEVLTELACRSGRTKNQVIRDALFLEKYAQDAWRQGGRVIVEREGSRYEVLPH